MAKVVGTRDSARASAMVAARIIRPERACETKHVFTNRNDAVNAIKSLFQRTGRRGAVYKCPFGQNHWHITKIRHGEDDA